MQTLRGTNSSLFCLPPLNQDDGSLNLYHFNCPAGFISDFGLVSIRLTIIISFSGNIIGILRYINCNWPLFLSPQPWSHSHLCTWGMGSFIIILSSSSHRHGPQMKWKQFFRSQPATRPLPVMVDMWRDLLMKLPEFGLRACGNSLWLG